MSSWNLAANLLVYGLSILLIVGFVIGTIRKITDISKKNALNKERLERERVLKVELALQAEWKQRLRAKSTKKHQSESPDWANLSSN